MKAFLFALTILLCGSAVWSQTAPATRTEVPAPQLPGSGRQVPVLFEAPVIEVARGLVRATGGVLMLSAERRITATSAVYNWISGEGVLTNVVFTTCSSSSLDYRIEAREIRLYPNDRVTARHVSLFLGKLKVLSLPTLRTRIGGRSGQTHIFPTPSFDKVEGPALSQEFILADSDRLAARADVRLALHHGLQGELSNTYALDGQLGRFPGRALTYEALRNAAMTVPIDVNPPAPREPREPPLARLREFARFSVNQRTYNVLNTGLMVRREPEIGLRYIAPALNLSGQPIDPRLETYPEILASWGRFRETPGGTGTTDRTTVSLTTGINVFRLGPNVSIQPLGQVSYSSYGTGATYKTAAFGLDASRIFPNGSVATVRYVDRHESGSTPFRFDRLVIFREVQGAFQVQLDRHIIGLAGGYDLDKPGFYDWSVLYGYRTDCIVTGLAWDWLQQRVSFDVTLINK